VGKHDAIAAVEQEETPVPTALPRTVLIVDERAGDRQRLAEIVASLGYRPSVHAPEDAVASVSDSFRPEVAFVGYAAHPDHALALIGAMAHLGVCPVIAILPEHDGDYIRAAAARGAFAYLVQAGAGVDALQAAIDVAIARFGQYVALQDAFGRRALVEQAKGILMALRGVDQDGAFDLLRAESRQQSKKLVEVAQSIVDSHSLLVPPRDR
jgi:response regulator NasT